MRILGSIVSFATLSALGQTWTQLPDFPGTARDDAASFSIGDHIFVGTGMEVGWGLTNDWYAFDALLETWWPMPPLPATPRQYCAAIGAMGRGYLFGGLDANGPLSELWRYDPGLQTWTQLESLPGPGRYASVVFSMYGQLFVCTGMLADGVPTNELWQCSLAGGGWTQMASLPGIRRHRACQCGSAFVAGGADSSYTALADGYAYDPLLDSWAPYPTLPAPRYSSAGALGIVLAGASSTSQVHNDSWLYDEATESWSSILVPPFAGGQRRGGVAGANWPSTNTIYYGLGSDNVQRYRDWWKLETSIGMGEHTVGAFTIFPNPASDLITIRTPGPAVGETCDVIDATGRTVLSTSLENSDPISVQHLAPGRYEVVVRRADVLWRSPLIKLP